jgi:HEPN domain-containing protein
MKNWEEVKILLIRADDDLESAKILNEYKDIKRKPTGVIVFHCQQAVEKFLKGYLASNDVEYPKTHDLEKLNKLCEKSNNEFNNQEIKNICKALTEYAVKTRYEDSLEITENMVKKAIDNAIFVKNFKPIIGLKIQIQEIEEANEKEETEKQDKGR